MCCARWRDVRFGAAPDAAWYVALARALKAAYAQRLTSLGDAEPQAAESCTTHITVCDADGTMVAMTTTLLSSMGSRVVLPATGILMNNGVMWFDPRPGQPNSIGPGKRPLTNMFPVILRDGAAPWIAAGASGGRRIMAAVLQLVSFVADFGMTPGGRRAPAAHRRVRSRQGHRRPAARAGHLARAGGRRADRDRRARRAADQFRLPQPDRAGRTARAPASAMPPRPGRRRSRRGRRSCHPGQANEESASRDP